MTSSNPSTETLSESKTRKFLSRLTRRTSSNSAQSYEKSDLNPDATKKLAQLFYCSNSNSSRTSTEGLLENPSSIPGAPLYSNIPRFLETARKLLESGAEPNVWVYLINLHGKTLNRVYCPAILFKEEILEDSGPYSAFNIEMAMKDYLEAHTPLTDAIYAEDEDTISLLLQYGAHIYAKEQKMRNPYLQAIMNNKPMLLTQLLNHTKRLDEEITHVWLLESMKKVFELAAPPDFGSELAGILLKESQNLPLISSEQYISHAVIDCSIQYGVAHSQFRYQGPQILTATYLDHLELCQTVVQGDEEISARDQRGMTALHVAAGSTTSSIYRFLLASSLELTVRDYYNMTPLLEAVYYGNLDVVRLLLDKGVDPNESTVTQAAFATLPKNRNCVFLEYIWRTRRDSAALIFKSHLHSAIHIAAYRGFTTCLQILVDHGADRGALNDAGNTVLDTALQRSNIETALWLVEHDFPFNPASEAASSFLVQAIKSCNEALVDRLVEKNVRLPRGNELWEAYVDGSDRNKSVPDWMKHLPRVEDLGLNRKYQSVCHECSAILSYFKVRPSTPKEVRKCQICSLIEDWGQSGERKILKYINHTASPDRELFIETGERQYLFPMRIIPCKWT